MANTFEARLHRELTGDRSYNQISNLIKKGVDCNWSYFDRNTYTFLSPIQMAVKSDQDRILCLLYENRNYPTEKHLKECITFYTNHYESLQEEKNAALLEYTVNCLTHADMMKYTAKDYTILIAGLYDFENVKQRGEQLSLGYHPEIFILLRIFSLVRRILQMEVESTIKFNGDDLGAMKKELLHNLEVYYLFQDIFSIPVDMTDEIMNESFVNLEEPYRSSLEKYYEYIARNVIKKIKTLAINQEYTIPSGWHVHAICISFRRINETHIHVRVDNPTLYDPLAAKEIKRTEDHYRRIKPTILGQLSLSNLNNNLAYFIELMDSIARDIPRKDGESLVYNTEKRIRHLEKTNHEETEDFLEQASTNCFLKCFEPGFRIRFGRNHSKLCEQLLAFEKDSANWLERRCQQKHQRSPRSYYVRFASLTEQSKNNPLHMEGKSQLQDKLKASYKQKYQYLPSFMIGENCESPMEKYVPLKFKKDNTYLTLENLFIQPRVLVLADAGCGKTTICEFITYSWACNKLWKTQFKWLFYIKLRNLNTTYHLPYRRNNNYSLIDIIETECFQGYQLSSVDKKRLTTQLENPSKILWILDGLDERATLPDYLQLIEQELLNKPNLLLTARPYVTRNFQYDMKVQIERFTEENIKDFLMKYFNEHRSLTKVEQCYIFIQSSEKLLQTAKIPVCLLIICNLWENNEETLDFILSIEELYEQMCEHLLQRYLLKFHGINRSTLLGKNIFQHDAAIGFAHLEYLAFNATESRRLTISRNEIATISNGLLYSVIDIGLLVSKERHSSSSFKEDDYYFIHRSFQEYLCVRYIIRILTTTSPSIEHENKVFQFVSHKKYDRQIQDTFRLFFEMKGSKLCIDKFWSAVDNEPRDLVGLRHCPRIIQWFPYGSHIYPYEEEKQINKRTTDVIIQWISDQNRCAHDYGNTYLFEWFFRTVPHYHWWEAWKDDLFTIKDPFKRRYFLPDIWSGTNIDILKNKYNKIPKTNLRALHRLIKEGPTEFNLKFMEKSPDLFSLDIVDEQIETSEILIAAQKKARKQKEVITLSEFQVLLENYQTFARLNRLAVARGSVIWRLKIATSAVINIRNNTLELLLQLIQENVLFYRDFLLPVLPFLKLYARSNRSNDDTLCSLIVSIAFASECILVVPFAEKTFIRVYQDGKFEDTELNENRFNKLINAFKRARDDYGYSRFFLC